jgi:linoleoyl-CoA desaturase
MAWRIGNAQYDLGGFAHPGGDAVVKLLKDTDATYVVTQYHPDLELVRSRIQKFKVGGGELPTSSGKYKGLHAKILEAVRKELGSRRSDYTWPTVPFLTFLAITACVYLPLMYHMFVSKTIVSGILASVSSMPLILRIFHEGSHRTLPFGNAALQLIIPHLATPYNWFFEHIVSHHAQTNRIGYDLDYGVVTRLDLLKKPFSTYLISLGVFLANKLSVIPITLPGGWFDLARFLVAVAVLIYYAGFQAYLAHALAFGIYFTFWANLSHFQPELESTPSYALREGYEDDWIATQAKTTCNYSVDSDLVFFLSFGLTHQVEHHIVPYVSHYHFRKLGPVFEAILHSYNLPYHKKTLTSAIVDFFRLYLPIYRIPCEK